MASDAPAALQTPAAPATALPKRHNSNDSLLRAWDRWKAKVLKGEGFVEAAMRVDQRGEKSRDAAEAKVAAYLADPKHRADLAARFLLKGDRRRAAQVVAVGVAAEGSVTQALHAMATWDRLERPVTTSPYRPRVGMPIPAAKMPESGTPSAGRSLDGLARTPGLSIPVSPGKSRGAQGTNGGAVPGWPTGDPASGADDD